MKKQKETWVEIEGFNDYKISNLGRIKSFKHGKTRILQTTITIINCKDRHYVKLYKNGEKHGFIVERLLYFCFGIGDPDYPQIHLSDLELETKIAKDYVKRVLG